jgi:hypothetical protein
MKSKMKFLLAFIVFALIACDDEPDKFVGKWNVKSTDPANTKPDIDASFDIVPDDTRFKHYAINNTIIKIDGIAAKASYGEIYGVAPGLNFERLVLKFNQTDSIVFANFKTFGKSARAERMTYTYYKTPTTVNIIYDGQEAIKE